MRHFLILLVSVTVGGLFLTGCSKKTPVSAASSEQGAGDGSSGATESDASSAGGANVSLSSLPTIYFGFNEYTIPAEDREKLKAASDLLKSSKAKVIIEGHCDERGSTEYNLALGEKRAQSVKGYLSKLGVPSANLSTISYGEERPAATGSDENSWAKNRRGEMVVNK